MRKLTLASSVVGVTLFLLAACSNTAETESNFKTTLSKYFANKANNPTCNMIALGNGFTLLSSSDVATYQALQKAGYITLTEKSFNQGFLGVGHKYTTALTEQGKAWVIDVKPMASPLYANSSIPLQQADYCLGTVNVTAIQDYTDFKRAEEYSGKKVVEVLFNYQIEGIPDNLKNSLGKPFQGMLSGKATLVAMTKGWHVDEIRLNQND